MLAKRIIPCLDVKNGRTVKGTNFVNLREAGDPVELGRAYSEQGADELVFLDITASHEGRKTFIDMVSRVAAEISIPFTVGGGIRELDDVARLLDAGADKVSLNSAALRCPGLIDDIARHFGSQVCVVAIDAKQERLAPTRAGHRDTGEETCFQQAETRTRQEETRAQQEDARAQQEKNCARQEETRARQEETRWMCYLNGGRLRTDIELFSWAREANERGAGEILFTSMDHDGVKQGFANDALARLSAELTIPVIASGGAGSKQHFADAFLCGKADAALAASVFHFGEIRIPDLKHYLREAGISVRL